MVSFSQRASLAVCAVVVLTAVAGCASGNLAVESPQVEPSPTSTVSTDTSAQSTPPPSGNAIQPDGSVTVCNGLTVKRFNSITGLKFTASQEGDPDSPPGSGYTTYSCIFYGNDPSTSSVIIFVNVGNANQVFEDNAHGVKDTFGWGPIDGVGDRAEGDGIHILDVLWGSRYVISVVDNTENSDVGVKNMAALATAVHEDIGE